MIENGTLLQDRYLIEKQIGAGGMGAVYLAIDQRFENHVAIKETFYTGDEFGDAFEREARLLNGLQHPVLPHVSDYFTDEHGHFLVMQFIEGEDLSAILKREGAFPAEDVLRWMSSLLDALDYLHSQETPIIHRDIKPQNLKITPRGDIVLLDFGLAKLKTEDTSGVKSVFGYSRKYSPLEQIQGTGTDARSDIFSLGATAYHLLTGNPPIDVLARAAEIVVGNPDPLRYASEVNPKVPENVACVINSALALNPASRFASAPAMRQALENAAGENLTETGVNQNVKPVVIENPTEMPVVISSENENFTALEAFAGTPGEGAFPLAEIKTATAESSSAPETDNFAETEALNRPVRSKAMKIVIPAFAANKNRNVFALITALLIGAAVIAGFVFNQKNSAEAETQTPVIQSAVDSQPEREITEQIPTAGKQTDSIDIERVSETSDQSPAENRINPRVEAQDAALPREPKREETEKAKPESSEKPEPNQPRSEVARRTEPPRGKTQSPRIDKPLPDIESIFTGRPVSENERISSREVRRSPRAEMTEEEVREMRRQRRKERRQRQDSYRFPF